MVSSCACNSTNEADVKMITTLFHYRQFRIQGVNIALLPGSKLHFIREKMTGQHTPWFCTQMEEQVAQKPHENTQKETHCTGHIFEPVLSENKSYST